MWGIIPLLAEVMTWETNLLLVDLNIFPLGHPILGIASKRTPWYLKMAIEWDNIYGCNFFSCVRRKNRRRRDVYNIKLRTIDVSMYHRRLEWLKFEKFELKIFWKLMKLCESHLQAAPVVESEDYVVARETWLPLRRSFDVFSLCQFKSQFQFYSYNSRLHFTLLHSFCFQTLRTTVGWCEIN